MLEESSQHNPAEISALELADTLQGWCMHRPPSSASHMSVRLFEQSPRNLNAKRNERLRTCRPLPQPTSSTLPSGKICLNRSASERPRSAVLHRVLSSSAWSKGLWRLRRCFSIARVFSQANSLTNCS